MAKDGSLAPNGNDAPVSPEQRQKLHRAGMIATLALLAVVLIALPMAIRSMAETLFGAQQATLYDLVTGGEVPPVASAIAAADQTYINLAVVALDPGPVRRHWPSRAIGSAPLSAQPCS